MLIVYSLLSNNYAVSAEVFEDVKLGERCRIKGVAAITLLKLDCVNMFRWYGDVLMNIDLSERYGIPFMNMRDYEESGSDGDFLWVKADVTNLTKQNLSFSRYISVKVFYNDEYEYNGWVYQTFNYEDADILTSSYTDNYPYVCYRTVHEKPLGEMYTGHYVFGCKLPIFVLKDDAPLKMVIKIGDNEIIYNIRK